MSIKQHLGFSQLKELPKDNWIFFTSITINRMGNMALVFLIIYLHKHLGFTLDRAGFIFGLYGLGAIIAGQLGGILSDYLGSIKTMVITLFFSGITLLIFPLVHSFIYIAILTFLWGIINESFRPANLSAIAQYCTAPQRKAAYALNRLGINLGMSIGPSIGGIIALYNFKLVFLINAISVLVACFLLVFYYHKILFTKTTAKINLKHSFINSIITPLTNRQINYAFFAMFLVSIVFFQHDTTLSVFVIDTLHLNSASFGMLFTINTVIIIFCEVPLNLYTAKWSFSLNLSVGALFITFGFGGLFFATAFHHLIIAAILWTIGEMFIFTSFTAYISDVTTIDNRGSYMGFMTSSSNFALFLAPVIGTHIISTFGFHYLWLSCAALGIIASMIFKNKLKDI